MLVLAAVPFTWGTIPVEEVLYQWSTEVETELTENILPFWSRVERPGGGYIGAMENDLRVVEDAPVSLILVTRLLWTYSRAYRELGDPAHLEFARRAYAYLGHHFEDREHGGYFWILDAEGTPTNRGKNTYGQAFALYGLSEYYRASGDATALAKARHLFDLLETRVRQRASGGYWEAFAEDWSHVEDMRVTSERFNAPFTMNTHLHILEAYTNFLQADDSQAAREATRRVLRLMLDRVLVPGETHFGLFFDPEWRRLDRTVSPGHDIEGSWLMWETSGLLNDPELLAEVRRISLSMARFTLQHGLGPDGQVVEEFEEGEPPRRQTSWWSQAEGVVGLFNAYQLSGESAFLEASQRTWDYIRSHIVDPHNGEWFAGRGENGEVLSRNKVGPWKTPYHNSRACMELLERIEGILGSETRPSAP